MAENKDDKGTDEQAPPPASPPPGGPHIATIRPMTPEEIRMAEAAEQARIVAEVEERNATTTVDGGRYMVDGVLVDAEGKALKDKKG